MRRLAAVLLLCSSFALAQDETKPVAKPSSPKATAEVSGLPLHKGASEIDVFTGGGTGFGKRSSTQFFYVGGRYGRVLTPDKGSGLLRGNFEIGIDVLPLYVIMEPPQKTFGASFNPLVLKWNFTSGRRMIPFVELTGGALITGQDVPFGTNNFNFTPQGGFGVHFLRKSNPKQAITFTGKFMHVSNASIADANSGINGSIQFILGYTWFKK
ncbi:MAG: Lipid 3-O-deacylase-related protein [Acidobacteriales bacterium]|nr:Lipid 3-O-deacylase-related protein [Terriglobales bacterium]